ncbi:MAG: hypothetical protein IKD78_07705 [Bacteroidales bacterium]|nr:hypothetical protein [Bacteroidales bacterium]
MSQAPQAKKIVSKSDVMSLIQSVPRGRFISVVFERVAPKCPVCGKSDKKWAGLDECPFCKAKLSKERESLCQFGVSHPQDESNTPKGTGETAKQAMADGRIKYYDPQIKNANGTLGGYRQCRAENIKRMVIDHIEYQVQ